MFSRLIRKFNLFLDPPKKGDVFYGDSLFFVVHKPMEYVLHGLKNINGETVFHPVPSKGAYRVTIELCGHLYYVLDSEVFCKDGTEKTLYDGIWCKRSQPKRIAKEMFEELILNGMLWRWQ